MQKTCAGLLALAFITLFWTGCATPETTTTTTTTTTTQKTRAQWQSAPHQTGSNF